MHKKLSDIFEYRAFVEVELKLNAENPELLDRIWDHVIDDPYYVPYHATNNIDLHNIDWTSFDHDVGRKRPPREFTEDRERFYWDTYDLDLFNNLIELRLERKGEKRFKQVIKFGNHQTHDPNVLHRIELPSMQHKFAPRLGKQAFSDKIEFKKSALDVLRETVSNIKKLRVITISNSQRSRMKYYPGEQKNVVVEIAIDKGKAVNIAGFSWPIRQVEFEIKKNRSDKTDDEILLNEMRRIQKLFKGLELTVKTKPSIGLEDFAARPKCEQTYKAFRDLPRDRFQIIPEYPEAKPAR